MKHIICIGAGPSGLYFALLMKLQAPELRITVLERNRAQDTFGWGVVLSDQTLENLVQADSVTGLQIRDAFNHWDDIELFFKGQSVRSTGHGFCGIGRQHLLSILQQRCTALGVALIYETEVDNIDVVIERHRPDLVLACDGLNSKIRTRFQDSFVPDIDVRKCRFVWLGTHKLFDAFTFAFEQTEHGWFQAHAYRYNADTSTFIVGTPVVLMGDSAHTAHFSIGSGTKLAMEDAIDLANTFKRQPKAGLPEVLQAYESRRSVEVLKIQNAARNSTTWFENIERYSHLEIEQFFYSLLTRSQRLGHENLRLRDPAWLAGYEAWFASQSRAAASGVPNGQATHAKESRGVPPMLLPLTVRGITLKNRIVVSPMAMYSAKGGVVGDFHLVHLGARAMGGAALVMVEMTSPTPEGRITLGCPGLWSTEQKDAFRRVVDFVHSQNAHMGLQLGHSGGKGSTQLGWQKSDEPIEHGPDNWPLMAASAVPYGAQNQTPKAMDLEDMAALKSQFVHSTALALEAGFDWLELHCAHGYLLSSFLSPLTNHRDDAYGGSLQARARFPLEVFAAMRAVWPVHLPMSVRISAHDWAPGGNTDDDAVEMARLFKAQGCDMIDVSSGQTTRQAKPTYGRMYQTPFADRIRNEVQIKTIAVGAITDGDQANGIIAAGRADLCALARPHLSDPAWTLHEAAKMRSQSIVWPQPYESGRDQLYRLLANPQ